MTESKSPKCKVCGYYGSHFIKSEVSLIAEPPVTHEWQCDCCHAFFWCDTAPAEPSADDDTAEKYRHWALQKAQTAHDAAIIRLMNSLTLTANVPSEQRTVEQRAEFSTALIEALNTSRALHKAKSDMKGTTND